MRELSDLVGIFGAIDREVLNRPERRDPVSRVLPPYESDAVHWFDTFEQWVKDEEHIDEAPFPDLDAALRDLAEIPPRGRMRARRLWTIAVAARAFPEIADQESSRARLARAALDAGPEEGQRARDLLAILVDDGRLPDPEDGTAQALDEWWDQLLRDARALELIDAVPEEMGPRPCTGVVVEVPLPDGTGTAAALTTTFETSAISFDRAKAFLHPANWPHCCPFWCEMSPRPSPGQGTQSFHEVVSLWCGNPLAWSVQAELDFSFYEVPHVLAATEYHLSHGHPQWGDDVQADEGSLAVHEIGTAGASRLRVITTKRIRFERYFTPEGLAMFMCVVGYASAPEFLLFSCAIVEAEPGTPFPTEPTTEPPVCSPVITALAEQAAAAVKACIHDCAQTAQEASDKIEAGHYTADDLVQDVAGTWVRMLRDGATAIDLGVRGAQAAARTRARGR
jgi:hypothetical protein